MKTYELLEQFFDDAGMKYKAHGGHGLYYDVGPSGEEFVVDVTPESDFYRRPFVKGDVVISVRPPFEGVDTKWDTNFFLNLHNPEFFSRLKKILQGSLDV